MRTRPLLVLAAVQIAIVCVYLAVESRREPEAPFAVERLDVAAPPLAGVDLQQERVLVHFWATWCVPCRDELPGLIEAARETDVPLVAITDEAPEPVAAFFPAGVPPEAKLDAVANEVWGVSGLPDTFVVEEGRIVARMGGARDWRTREARRFLETM